jgi:hypothetical protein
VRVEDPNVQEEHPVQQEDNLDAPRRDGEPHDGHAGGHIKAELVQKGSRSHHQIQITRNIAGWCKLCKLAIERIEKDDRGTKEKSVTTTEKGRHANAWLYSTEVEPT